MSAYSSRWREAGFYFAMVAPAVVLFLSVVGYPVVFSVVLGFTEYNFRPGDVFRIEGLQQYRRMLDDPRFWIGFRNSFIVVGVSVFGQIPLGFALAYLLFRGTVRGGNFFQAMVFLPQAISLVVVGLLFRNFFGVRGAATELVRIVTADPGFTFRWFRYEHTAMIPIAIALLWIYTGFYLIVFRANLQSMDTSMLEAAQIDGANEIQMFGRIVVPALAGVILINTVLAISGSFKGFDLFFALAPNEGQGIANFNLVLPTYMYHAAFQPRHYAFGSAISNVIMALSISIIGIAKLIYNWVATEE